MSDKDSDNESVSGSPKKSESKASSPSTKAAPMEEDDNAAAQVATTEDPKMGLGHGEMYVEINTKCRAVPAEFFHVRASGPLSVGEGMDSKKVLKQPCAYMNNVKTSALLGQASMNSGIGLMIDKGDFGPEHVAILKFEDQHALTFSMVAEDEDDQVKIYYDAHHLRFMKESMINEMKKNATFLDKLEENIAKKDKHSDKYAKMKRVLLADPSKTWVKASEIEKHLRPTSVKKAPTSAEKPEEKTLEEKAQDAQEKANKLFRQLEKSQGKGKGKAKGGGQTTLATTSGAGPSGAMVQHSGETQEQTGKLIEAMSGFEKVYNAAKEHGRLERDHELQTKQNERFKKRIAELEAEVVKATKKKKA